MEYLIEEIYRTEGIPQYTFVEPPNYNSILVDVRNPTKPLIIEGQSGTGKTVTILKIIEQHCQQQNFEYLSARKPNDIVRIVAIAMKNILGKYVIDDFHRLDPEIQEAFANIIKIAAEEGNPANNSKIILIGINKVGSSLIHLVHDIAKRCGIHKILPGSQEVIQDLVKKGEDKLNIQISDYITVFNESRGDYWLSQLICQSICLFNNVLKTCTSKQACSLDLQALRDSVTNRLEHAYAEPVREFCRGKRFRSTNDPYYKLLKLISQQESSLVDLTELANANPDVKGSINNVKERRLSILLESKPICDRYFFYDSKTKNFAIEDPAMFYYIKNVNWVKIRNECGFRYGDQNFDFDFAISFAGANRDLARLIAKQLEIMDCAVFFDELFEANYLGTTWRAKFKEIFSEKSRFVVCLLDVNNLERIWPTFERECFQPRVSDEAVIPIFLDSSIFPGIPQDIVGIDLRGKNVQATEDFVTDNIVFKLLEKIESI